MTAWNEVQPSNSKKPDPDAPCRYGCPECGSISVQVASHADETWRCLNCKTTVERLYDRRTETEVYDL